MRQREPSTNVSIAATSYFRLWVLQRSTLALAGLWLLTYCIVAVVFSVAYAILPACAVTCGNACAREFGSLLYFSFTTQATVGYGDCAPLGVGRILSVLQAFVGVTMNALILGVVAFKSLKPGRPIQFSRYIVYDQRRHEFWIRFVNTAADSLREGDLQIDLNIPVGSDHSQTAYDTQTAVIKARTNHVSALPPLLLFAPRTESNHGETPTPVGDFQDLCLSPLHFARPKARLHVALHGYFESTGDPFFASRVYSRDDIVCGSFDSVNNHEIMDDKDETKAKHLSAKLDKTTRTKGDDCVLCPHHAACPLDVAVGVREVRSRTP